MKITDLLSPDRIFLGQRAADKRRLLEMLSRLSGQAIGVSPEAIHEALMRRESLGSTGMGGGVALPHARLEDIEKPFAVVVTLSPSIEYDAIDGARVDVVALVLLPARSDGHGLNALACLARRLREQRVVTSLRKAATQDAAFAVLVSD